MHWEKYKTREDKGENEEVPLLYGISSQGSAFWIFISVPTFEGMEHMFAKCSDNFEDCWAVTLPSVWDPRCKCMLPDQNA